MEEHAIVITDTNGVIQLWSRGCEILFGYEAAEALGKSLDLIVPTSLRNKHWGGFQIAMAAGQSKLDGTTTQVPVACKDGSTQRFPTRIALVRDANETLIGVMAVFSAASPARKD